MYRNAHWWFLAVFVVVLGGFGPTFFTRLGETALPYLIHGFSATLWILMLVTQSWLITRRRGPEGDPHRYRRWHRRLGWSSLVVFPVMLTSGFYMIRLMLTVRAEAYGPLAWVLAFIDIPTLLLLAVFYVLALVHRRRVALHSRYMSATAILLLPPALGRFLAFWVPGIPGLVPALNPMMGITQLSAAVLVLHDWRRGGRIHPPYPITLAALILLHAGMWRAPEWGWWRSLALALVGGG
jgi:hypothetical protein